MTVFDGLQIDLARFQYHFESNNHYPHAPWWHAEKFKRFWAALMLRACIKKFLCLPMGEKRCEDESS